MQHHAMNRTSRSSKLLAGSLAAVLTIATLAGCDSFLQQKPLGQLTTENFFETEEDAVAATNAVYEMLRGFRIHVFPFLGMTSIASDLATKGSTPTDAAFLSAFDNLNWLPTNSAFRGTWNAYYRGIYRANVALENIPPIEMDEELKARLLAENKFLRAYFYFFLVRAYGGVPLITEPLESDEFEQPRASAEEIYALIEQDLLEAIEVLPPRSGYPASEYGRATRGAARALLAKVYLFQEEYQEALQYAEAVINSGEYSLTSDYSFIFTVEGEFSSGSVFEVAVATLPNSRAGTSQYAQVHGVRGFPNLGWGFNQPSDRLEELYEPGDRRQQATILYPWEIVEPGADVIVHYNPNLPNQQYSEKAQRPLAGEPSDGNPVNIRRLRLSDVLLIAAEAAYQTGNTGKAQEYLNRVRRRIRSGRAATLGIIAEPLDEQLAAEILGLAPATKRVFVRYVGAEGPAASSGIRAIESSFLKQEDTAIPALIYNIDIIQSVDGVAVATSEEYFDVLRTKSPGQTVTLDVLRVSQDTTGSGEDLTVTTSTETLQFDITAAPYLPDVTATGQALLEAIWHERAVELAMEQHRWFNLIRTRQAAEAMAAIGLNFKEFQRLYPIPQTEVALAELEQNPGY